MASVARATLIMVGAFVVAAACDYAFGAGMSWMLTPEQYGTLSVALTYFLFLSFFVASGFPMSLAKALAERDAPPRGLVRDALLANLVVAVVVVALFLGLTFYGPLSPGPGYGRLVIAVAIAVLLLSVGTTLQYALQGRLAFASFAILHASKSVNKLVFGALFVVLGFGLAGAVGGLVVGAAFLALASLWLLRRDPGGESEPLTHEERRGFLRYTGQVFVGSFALTILMTIDLLGVKYLTPEADSNRLAAYYQSATLLTKAPLWAVVAGMSILYPLMSRASQRDPEAARRMLRNVLRWTVLAIAPLVAVLVAFPRQTLSILFPPAYAAAAPALAVSALGMGALAICLVLTRALQASGHARAPGAYLFVSAALQVALLFALVPRYGPVGAALATAIACTIGALLALGQSIRAFRLRVGWEPAVAFAACLGLLVATVVAYAPVTPGRTVLALAVGGALYAGAIVVSGLISEKERHAVLARLLPRATRGATPATEEA